MRTTILVAGGTGNLGGKIIRELIRREADVRAIVRSGTPGDKLDELELMGVHVVTVDTTSAADLRQTCEGVACVVSAVAGLEDVIVGFQSRLLEAALEAGVPRFIPSDFSTDFNPLVEGDNRNFDLRRKFKAIIDQSRIQATSIFIGSFAENLMYGMPVLDLRKKIAGYVESADQKVDFTTTDDAAAFTAEVALDKNTPRNLHIASFQVSANDLAKSASALFEDKIEPVRLASLDELREKNKADRAADPAGESQLYPRWQQAQYLHSMFSVETPELDNEMYPELEWTDTEKFLLRLQHQPIA